MRHDQQGALAIAPPAFQVLRQPVDGAHVKMVRRLVEHEDVPVAHEQARQVDPASLAARKGADQGVPGNVPRNAGNRLARASVCSPLVFGRIAHDGAPDGVFVA